MHLKHKIKYRQYSYSTANCYYDLKMYPLAMYIQSSICSLHNLIAKDGGAKADILQRISKARIAFSMLHKTWKSSYISK